MRLGYWRVREGSTGAWGRGESERWKKGGTDRGANKGESSKRGTEEEEGGMW